MNYRFYHRLSYLNCWKKSGSMEGKIWMRNPPRGKAWTGQPDINSHEQFIGRNRWLRRKGGPSLSYNDIPPPRFKPLKALNKGNWQPGVGRPVDYARGNRLMRECLGQKYDSKIIFQGRYRIYIMNWTILKIMFDNSTTTTGRCSMVWNFQLYLEYFIIRV